MRIEVRNFQSIERIAIETRGFTLLVGDNDIGKTALVRSLFGLLYGLAGDHFIRFGHASTTIRLSFDADPNWPAVELELHKGTPTFMIIDGTSFDKFGRAGAIHLKDFGVREFEVGDRKYRPQTASQGDPFFLLGEPGSVTASIITATSRLEVVSQAMRTVATDIKETATAINVKTDDIESTTRKLALYSGVPAFSSAVSALDTDLAVVQGSVSKLAFLEGKQTDLAALTARRAVLDQVSKVRVPKPSSMKTLGSTLAKARSLNSLASRFAYLTKSRQALTPVAAVQVPIPPKVQMTRLSGLLYLARQMASCLQTRRSLGISIGEAQLALHRADQQLREFKTKHPQCPLCGVAWDDKSKARCASG